MLAPQQCSKDARISARRDQIIAAARLCFRKHGFHGAGMAEIAKTSQLSVGQIYRYFANKDAIIEEIVRRMVMKKIQLITGNAHNLQQIAHNLAHRRIGNLSSPFKEDVCSEQKEQAEIDHALMLEVAAEATRNPAVEKIWRDSEKQLFNEAKSFLSKSFPQFSDEEMTAKVESLAVICEGTAFRRLTTVHADAEVLEALYHRYFQDLFNTDFTPSKPE
ncbi:MAG: TetR/AcrR family transcriptional regulator [Rahnella inusitata]|jgi:AcrR family transcriptional regulator|uniref:TetR family transcriptional regulator n=1 Tax=Rahnella inusitata TaxID=58169 RepID=A0ABX9P3C3_9GAMM|nr:TetR family transcriptional regulator [Rahnella inusitata]NMC25414.1 TetR family transcriptional regulator [Serratia sp. (in: enterobacteria)]QUT14504.1 TetR family transcriptional regulator [Rahnella inusitata]RJT15294.1 TetR family transcriptional regulator [Rahnella inusitata]